MTLTAPVPSLRPMVTVPPASRFVVSSVAFRLNVPVPLMPIVAPAIDGTNAASPVTSTSAASSIPDALTDRSPLTVEATRVTACAFVIVASPVVPFVQSAIVPVTFNCPNSMSVLANTTLNEASPTTTTLPLSTMFPPLAVAERFPPTAEVVRFKPSTPVTVAWPSVSFVVRPTAPVTFNASSSVIVALARADVNDASPVTITFPLSTMLPAVAFATRLPFTVEVLRLIP